MNSRYYCFYPSTEEVRAKGDLSWYTKLNDDLDAIEDSSFEGLITEMDALSDDIAGLNLSANFLGMGSVEKILILLEKIKPSVVRLDLSYNCLHQMSAPDLMLLLTSLPLTLEVLDLHHNHLGRFGFEQFQQVIRSIPASIGRIVIHHNHLDYEKDQLDEFLASFAGRIQLNPANAESLLPSI